MSETVKCSEVQKTCHYAAVISDSRILCDYIGMTGKRRGCDPEKCDKYKPASKTKAKERLNKSINERMGGYLRSDYLDV